MSQKYQFFNTLVPALSVICLLVIVLKEIVQIITEKKEYFTDIYNYADFIVCILVIICQYYYFNTGEIVNGYFFPGNDSLFELFLLPTILVLHLNLILQHMIAFRIIR